jgi:1-acyl-sn-glycerol-3-phosphate acyltransferase
MTSTNQPTPWIHRLIRFLIFNLVRLFYPRLEIQGREHLPAEGPVIFVLNHPNGLLDPVVLMLGLQQPVAFLAKSTLFGNPVGRAFMGAFGAIPVYRQQDEGLTGGPQAGQMREMNEKTFARCRALLRGGGAMAMFPEGKSHSGSRLLQLRTGAARIALGAEAEAGWDLGLRLVPVGLWYQKKTDFRSSVLLIIRPAFDLQEYAKADPSQEQQTVKALTRRIEDNLSRVVLQAENAELLAAVPLLASWVAPAGQALALPEQHDWTARLLAAYERLQSSDPARLEKIAGMARRYANALQTLGIRNPWALELPQANRRRLRWLLLLLVLTAPLALAGFLLSYLPYRLARPLANALTGGDPTLASTFKLIGGSILVLLGWLAEAILCGIWFGPGWGLALFLAAPLLGYIALRWGEIRVELQELAAYGWLRLRHQELVQALTVQRQALAQEVLEAVVEKDEG